MQNEIPGHISEYSIRDTTEEQKVWSKEQVDTSVGVFWH
jgi:hypothetical protein